MCYGSVEFCLEDMVEWVKSFWLSWHVRSMINYPAPYAAVSSGPMTIPSHPTYWGLVLGL